MARLHMQQIVCLGCCSNNGEVTDSNEEVEMVLRYCQCNIAISAARELIVTRATVGQIH